MKQRHASWVLGQINGIALLGHTQDKLVPLTVTFALAVLPFFHGNQPSHCIYFTVTPRRTCLISEDLLEQTNSFSMISRGQKFN